MTPDAGEGAPFKKDGDADAGTVVDGIAFDVEDQRLFHELVRPEIYVSHQDAKDTKKDKTLTERRRDGEKSLKSFFGFKTLKTDFDFLRTSPSLR